MKARLRLLIAASLLAVGAGLPVGAQTTTPSTGEMIDQLKPVRTRSLRNLTVEVDAPTQAALSLRIDFEFNSANIRPGSYEVLRNLAQALQSNELVDTRFTIEGHTDAKGSASYNLRLSQQRAQAVANFLTAQGLAPTRMVVVGKGSSELADIGQPFAAKNRRVRVLMMN